MNLSNEEIERFEKEIQEYSDLAAKNALKAFNDQLDKIYTDVIPHAYGDALCNFRNAMYDDLVSEKPSKFGFVNKKFRQKIWEQHKSELVELLNHDLLEENKRLNRLVSNMQGRDYLKKFL